MLGFLFGFNARIGRLQYFLGSVALAIFMTMIIFAITSSAIHGSIGAHGAHGSAREFVASLKWPLIGVGAIFLLISFMLQSMRFRDIGWDPVCVIPAWIAIVVIDALVAARFPALSIGRDHHGTIIGAVVKSRAVSGAAVLAGLRLRSSTDIPHARPESRPAGAPAGRRVGAACTHHRGAIRSPRLD